MWRIDVLQSDGTIKREQHSKTFVGLSERAARAAFQPILDRVNAENHATPPVPKNLGALTDTRSPTAEAKVGRNTKSYVPVRENGAQVTRPQD
jgi:hypothetical protein